MAAVRVFLILVAALAAPGCVQLTLAWADLRAAGPEASPPVLGALEDDAPVASLADWRARRAPKLRRVFEDHVYGAMPDGADARLVGRRVIDDNAFGGAGSFEEFTFTAAAEFGGVSVPARGAGEQGALVMAVAYPRDAAGPAPVILMETFCPRWATLPHPDATKPAGARGEMGGFFGAVATYVFGRHICTPPVEDILEAGYAIATIYPGEIVPDAAVAGNEALARLSEGYEDDGTRWGAVAAWGWAYSRMVDVLEGDPRFDRDAMIVWGHSRYAKAALVAAAFDPRIDGVIAHQSGTGGASLNRRKKGESVKAITETYPHWFAEPYAAYAGREEEMPVDQHQLLALVAPRPVLLGNARRDVWSDPNGAFRAAIGADPVYELHGARGLDQERLDRFNPGAELALWMRPGTHGVVKEDWPAFLAFLDAHFGSGGREKMARRR